MVFRYINLDLDEHEIGRKWIKHFVRNVGHLFGKDFFGLVGFSAIHENSQSPRCRINQEDQLGISQRNIIGKKQKGLIEHEIIKSSFITI